MRCEPVKAIVDRIPMYKRHICYYSPQNFNMREVISSFGSEVPNVPEPITHKSTTTVAHFLFAFTITLGAFLLFSVQLLVGKYLLPWFGGAVGVWTTCLLFFQIILLAGYAYVHGSARRLASRSQTKAHTALLLISLAALALT